MGSTTNVVNLDALIPREDLAAPGELGEDINGLYLPGLEAKGLLYPTLRKPDFQRETANWGPEQVADLIRTFMSRELVPAVILWRAGQNVFVIDGAHRLSALIAWVHDDYGDGERSRRFFQNAIPDEQERAANRTRELVKLSIGSYADHKMALEFPESASADLADRAKLMGWAEVPAQWIRNASHDKAEKAFFRINQGGTKIDKTEKTILAARRSAVGMSSRAIVRGGTGHAYWKAFSENVGQEIEALGKEVRSLLFDPSLDLPIKTLDVPLAGQGYGPATLPFVFDLVMLANKVSPKSIDKSVDFDGGETIEYLKKVKKAVERICSTSPSSLGLHPALYFYSRSGVFQPVAFLAYVSMFSLWDTRDFLEFTKVRAEYERFILSNRGITEAVRRLGSGARARPRITSLYQTIISELRQGKSLVDIGIALASNPDYNFLIAAQVADGMLEPLDTSFSRDTKGAAFLRDALPSAPKCPTCQGLMHRHGMQVGHQIARRDGGAATLDNAMMQHPFCNSTFAN